MGPARSGASTFRFFFGIRDGDHFARDPEELELAKLKEVSAQAQQTLVDLTKTNFPRGEQPRLVLTAHDGSANGLRDNLINCQYADPRRRRQADWAA